MADENVTDAAETAEVQTTAEKDAVSETGIPVEADAGASEERSGEEKAASVTDADEKESDTDQQAEVLNIAVPEGMEGFKTDFDAFNAEMGTWLKTNPNATAADALKEAALRQARLASEARNDAVKHFETQVANWEKEAKSDPAYGGADFDKNMAQAVKAIDAFGSDKFKALLNESGLGSHPEVIRFALKAAQGVSESDVVGSTAVPGDETALRSRYPSSQG